MLTYVFSPVQPIKWQLTLPGRQTSPPAFHSLPSTQNDKLFSPCTCNLSNLCSSTRTSPLVLFRLPTGFQPSFHHLSFLFFGSVCWLRVDEETHSSGKYPSWQPAIDFVSSVHLGSPALFIASKKVPYQICSSSLLNSAKISQRRWRQHWSSLVPGGCLNVFFPAGKALHPQLDCFLIRFVAQIICRQRWQGRKNSAGRAWRQDRCCAEATFACRW